MSDYAIETGTITFDNGDRKIVLKGIWKCTKECINSKGQKYSEVSVGGLEEPIWKGSLLDGVKNTMAQTEACKETVGSISCDICQDLRDMTREEHKELEAISNAVADYEKDFSRPNTIKISQRALSRLYNYFSCGQLHSPIQPISILGMKIVIDNSLKDTEAIIYDDRILYTNLRMQDLCPFSKISLEDCKKSIDTIKDTNSNPIMFPSEIDTLKDLNCNKYSDNVVSLNKDRIVNKHDLKEAVIKSLKRVNESKMWDLIERNAIKRWAKNFFNLVDGDLK